MPIASWNGQTPAASAVRSARLTAWTPQTAPVDPFDVRTVNDVPTLNKALKSGAINQNQWMSRFQQLQPSVKAPTLAGSLAYGLKQSPGVIGRGVNSMVQPIEQIPANASIVGANALSRALGRGQITAQQAAAPAKSQVRAGVKSAGATGSKKQLAGDVAQAGLLAASPAIDEFGVAAASKILPRGLVPAVDAAGKATGKFVASGTAKTVGSTAANTAIGYGFGASGAAGNGATAKQANKAGLVNAALGGGLTLGGTALGKGVSAILNNRGSVPTPKSAFDNHVAEQTKSEQNPSPAPTDTPPKTKTAPVRGNAALKQGVGQGSTVTPKAGLGEAGGVAPGQVVADTQAMLDRHAKLNAASTDLQKGYDITQNKNQLNTTEVAKNLEKRTALSPADKQTLQNYRDAKAAGLTPEPLPAHLQEADASATAYAKAQMQRDAAAARASGNEGKAQKIESRDPASYTHREAIGKGGNLELLMRGDRNDPSSVGMLGRKTSSSNGRNLMALTDESGNRRIVNIDKNKVTALENGGKTRTPLGNLNLKSNADFLEKELQPFKTKISNLQKEGNALSSVKTTGGVSQARITALARKASLLEDPGNMSTLTKSEAKSLRDAKIKLQELTNVKDTGTSATNRLKTINQHLIDMNNKVAEIHAKYDPETLDKKSFVGADGKKYTVGQATTAEIAKHAGQKYYTDPELTNALAYTDSQKALNNTHFIESTKQLLEDRQLAYPKDTTAPKNFRTTSNPYFPGYKLDPKMAETLDDIAGRTKHSTTGEGLDAVSHFLRQTIVYLPIKHDFNMAAGYAIDRGLTKWINPAANFRAFMSLRAAAKSLATHDQFYQDVMKTDFKLVSGDSNALGKVVKSQLKDTLNNKERLALFAKTTKLNPVRAYKALQQVSVFDVQDILNLARIKERTTGTLLTKGQSLEDAVANTKKYNFQYQMPSRAALPGKAGRIVKETLGSDKVYFGHYTYDKFRIAKNILKDTVNVTRPKQALEAADKLAATVFIASVAWPLVDKGVQKLTGNSNAHITAPGIAGVAETAQQVLDHKKAPLAAAGSQVSIAQPISLGSQLLNNSDSFKGGHIWDVNASAAQKGETAAKWLATQGAPVQKFNSSQKNTIGNKTLGTALGLAGVSIPKNSPQANRLDSLKYDSLPMVQTQAKGAGNLSNAANLLNAYNHKVLTAAKADLKAKGQPIPDDQSLIKQLKKSGYYYQPSTKTMQKWFVAKSPTKGGFVK